MFFPGSRYETAGAPYVTQGPDGAEVARIPIPVRLAVPIVGYHRQAQGDRLDLLAHRYLSDPTAFWLLCDVNDAFIPSALAARGLIGIPASKS